MNKKRATKKYIFIIVFFIVLVISMISAIGLGPVKIDYQDVYSIILYKLFGNSESQVFWAVSTEKIIWDVRFPRVLLGALVGAGLAVSGVSIQAFTKNPLSDPYILGISSGASAGAVSVALMGLFKFLGYYALAGGAFLGALVATFLVYNLSKGKLGITPTKLILTGVAVSALFSSITNFVIYNSKNETGIRTAMYWMMGSLEGAKWDYLSVIFIIFSLSFLILYAFSRALNAMLLGEQTAIIVGVDIQRLRKMIIIIASFLAGVVVSVSGSIGFVGLIIPHVVRNLFGSDHRIVLPCSALLGGIFIIWADVIARLVVAPQELPIGIVTSMVGAPFFIYLLKKNKYSFGG